MTYKNLNELIKNSSSSRKYFLSLPVWMQLELHSRNDFINTAEGLHRNVEAVQQQNFFDG
ncbi:MAG: hypothetical protein IJV39_00115 [Ruminococcus sp.]|nr:hypothetical protein [Ruminococcus sp.]